MSRTLVLVTERSPQGTPPGDPPGGTPTGIHQGDPPLGSAGGILPGESPWGVPLGIPPGIARLGRPVGGCPVGGLRFARLALWPGCLVGVARSCPLASGQVGLALLGVPVTSKTLEYTPGEVLSIGGVDARLAAFRVLFVCCF